MDRTTAHPGHDAAACCPPTGLSRRSALRALGLLGAGAAAGAAFGGTSTRVAYADTTKPYDGDVIVVISLHGGMDGLSMIAPIGDPDYAPLRPTVAVPASQAIAVDRTFGLNPALAPLQPLWDAGRVAAVHAVGTGDRTRSHFSALDTLERADATSSLRTGWINRLVGLRGDDSTFLATQFGGGVDGACAGPARTMQVGSLDTTSFVGATSTGDLDRWAATMAALHADTPSPLAVPTASAFAAVARTAGFRDNPLPAGYPDSPLGKSLAGVGALIHGGVGLQLAVVDTGDWDHHASLTDRMSAGLGDLAASLAAFAADLGAAMQGVTVLTLSEFGRRAGENGTGGADHGHGNAVLLMSGALTSSAVFGTWPTLAPDALDAGDLAATTDYRDILAEILTVRGGASAADLATVFPGYTPNPVGAFRP